MEASPGFYGIGRSVTIPAGGSRASLTFDVTLYAQVKAIMRREQFDVVHLHEPFMPVLPYMVLLNSKAANVATFHAYRTANPWYTAFKPYMSALTGRLDARIAVSEPAREFVSTYFEGSYDIVPNGIDTDLFGKRSSPSPGHMTISRESCSSAASMSRARASSTCSRRWPWSDPSSPRRACWSLARATRRSTTGSWTGLNLYGSVDFAGFVEKAELPRYYASCDILCAPSTRNESFGIILLEGMASGRPVVASEIPGYASVITTEQEGLLVPPKEPTDLAMALVRLLADRELRMQMGKAGLSTAGRHSWRWIAQRVLTVYDRAMNVAPQATWRQGFA